MDLVRLYAVCLAALAASLLVIKGAVALGISLRQFYVSHVRKRAVYPLLNTRWPGTTNVTLLETLVIVVYMSANGACLAIKIAEWSDLSRRSGLLCVINLVPAFAGGRSNILSDKIFRIEKRQQDLVHRWTGRVCVIQGSLHAFISIPTGSAHVPKMALPVSHPR